MLDLRHISLAAVLVLTTGMTGCNDNTNSLDTNTTVAKSNAAGEANLPTETVDRAVATIKAYALDNTKTAPTPTDYTNAGITGVNATNVASVNAQLDNLVSLFTDDVVTKVQAVVYIINGDTTEILKKIGNEHQDHNSIITVAELQAITPALENINDDYENIYRTYIASADSNISSPATRAEVQTMIDDVNALNLPEHAIVDRSFFTKTNGAFEHRFVYLPVESNTTGRTWINNNLGAEYANLNSSDYNPSHQATASSDHLAYGSLFQWGREADGHELIDWSDSTHGEPLYGTTTTTADDPSNSLWIISSNFSSSYDWRVHRDDTLWASESSANNVCPVGYRLPLNPNGVSDGENEWFVEMSTWSAPDANGSISSDLKLSSAGQRYSGSGQMERMTEFSAYWTGSDYGNSPYDIYFGDELDYNDYSSKSYGYSVRCIKDQTPAERSDSILLEIENEHNRHKSVITVAQLKAITPPLEKINDDKEYSYRRYIANANNHFSSPATREEVQIMIDIFNTPENVLLSLISTQHKNGKSDIRVAQLQAITPALDNIEEANEKYYQSYIEGDTHFSSPATRDEVQHMITEVNNLNLPKHAILDRSFFKKTKGVFEHRFVYLPVTNPKTGRTWLNNNLGAEYANLNSSDYNASEQATESNDHLAYGSLFQWGRKADGHELTYWYSDTYGTKKYGHTSIKSNDLSNLHYIIGSNDWRVTSDDTLWASESSKNNVCPVGYRLPLDPNGANDGENEWYQETQTWSSKDPSGAINSVLKLPMSGYSHYWSNDDIVETGNEASYWFGSANGSKAKSMDFYPNNVYSNANSVKAYGFNVRCIKDQTPAKKKISSTLAQIGREHNSAKSTITIAQLKAITPALKNINDNYESIYQEYIASADSSFSSPATRDEVQSMIDEVNSFNLPTNAILDRNFYKKTNGTFEHKFVYLPVTNPKTGRTWLNNNLGAEYANRNSSDYNPSQQATAGNDHLAYGSLFQWGREADGHELINWSSATTGTPKYDATFTTTDVVNDALFIIERGANRYDWKMTQDDTLWANESSPNNVCPVGYRLPLNPNGANDSENEFYIETQTWRTKDPSGAYRSVLKMPISGYRNHFNGNVKQIGAMASYWSGSPANTSAHSMDFYPDIVYPNEISPRTYGFNVRCIKEQTPAEKKTFSTFAQIGREHNSAKSTITIAQLKAITPALKNIKDNYKSIYQEYIASADSSFSSPATRDEVQSMIDALRLSKLGSYDTTGWSCNVTLSSDGTKAYIADDDNGLVIVDISDPANPIKLGSYDTAGSAKDITLSSDNTKAYVADRDNGLVIVDISDPANPIKLGSYDTAGSAQDITLSSDNTKAYIADYANGLVIVDISDPAHPTKFGSYDIAFEYLKSVTLSSDGTKAYVADSYNGLVIIDISDPAHPTKLGSYDTAGGANGVTLSSDGTKAYVAAYRGGLVIVDVSDPAHATKLGSYDIDEYHSYTYNVTLSSDGTKAYVAADKAGLVIVDISDPAHPTKIDSYDTAGKSYSVTLSSDGTKAYIADGFNGLVIILVV